MRQKHSVASVLLQHQPEFSPVVPFDLNSSEVCPLDFTNQNSLWMNQNLKDTHQFNDLVNQMLINQQARIGIGGYLENRVIYRRSSLFAEPDSARTIHLGVDIWAPSGTPLYAPLDGIVHSYQDNARFGDYGPTIILQHKLDSVNFYTLYGHLIRTSLPDLFTGKEIYKGQEFATIGPYPENGDWPAHLHFQLITNMLDFIGDFPGVCAPEEIDYFKEICPNPNLILKSRHLTAI